MCGFNLYRHLPRQVHGQCLEEQCKARASPRPRYRNQFNPASVLGALLAWSTCGQIRLILEKVHVAPRFLSGVMHWNQVTAHWTGKSGSAFKININVKSFAFLGKGDADYLPRVVD